MRDLVAQALLRTRVDLRPHDGRSAIARGYKSTLIRYERSGIPQRAWASPRARAEEATTLIVLESGLCGKDSLYEIGRAAGVLVSGATRPFATTARRLREFLEPQLDAAPEREGTQELVGHQLFSSRSVRRCAQCSNPEISAWTTAAVLLAAFILCTTFLM